MSALVHASSLAAMWNGPESTEYHLVHDFAAGVLGHDSAASCVVVMAERGD